VNKDELLANYYKLMQNNELSTDDVTGLIRGLISYNPELAKQAIEMTDDQLKQTSDLLVEAKNEKSIGKVDRCLELLSRRYSMLLAQIGTVEAQLEMCEILRVESEKSESQVIMGTMPLILIIELVHFLKSQIWATITWENNEAYEDKKINERARLVRLKVEPNKMWDGKINFVFAQEGYVTEQDFNRLCQKLKCSYVYYNN
jgi:hypothetical protein